MKIIVTALTALFLGLLTTSVKSQVTEEIFQTGNSLHSQGKYREALVYVDSSLRMDSSLYQRYSFRAEIKGRLGMYESAIEDVTRCINKCYCPTRKYHVSRYYLDRAKLQFLNKNYSAAFADAESSISSNARNWETYYFRSMVLIQTGNLQDAMTDLNTSIRIDDNQATTFMARGKLKLQMGDQDGACSDFSRVAGFGFDEYEEWVWKNCK